MQPDSFKDKIADILERAGGIQCRRMFQYWGLYHGNHFIGIIRNEKVYLRTNRLTRDTYIRSNMKPLHPSDRTLHRFYEVPFEIIDDPPTLIQWTLAAASIRYTTPRVHGEYS